MVTYLSRWEHQYTVKKLRKEKLFRLMSYDQLLARKSIPVGTYIFTDIDRLGPWELELAAIICRLLKAAGAQVLNDPARVRTRYELLRALHREGLNTFDAYRPSEGEWPMHYPVFIRRNHFHTGALSELIEDETGLRAALEQASNDGIPDSNLIAVEYCAQELTEGLFRKHAVYRIGDDYVRELSVHENHWAPKYGTDGIAPEELYQEELEQMRKVPHLQAIQQAFELANIEYGRVDFGLVDGQPQFYEINTNPAVGFGQLEHRYHQRIESHEIFKENYRSGIQKLTTSASSGKVRLDHPMLIRQRKLAKKHLGRIWSQPTI